MSPAAIQLEELRQQIQELEWEISQHTDYVDHGRPDPKPSRRVLKLREQSQQARARLRAAIELVRREKPEAFTEWVNYHKDILKRIRAETSTEQNADTRRNMAGFALEQWEKVATGEQEFVYINQHFLKDYSTVVSKVARQNPTSIEANKPWWQFWK